MSLLRKKIQEITDDRAFWRIVKPFLSKKSITNEKSILFENEDVLANDSFVDKVLSNFFLTS